MYGLLDSLGRGRPVEIPSIGVTIRAPFYATHTGRACADWRCADYLRQWLSDEELWSLLESMPPARLARLGFLIQHRLGVEL